MRNKVKIQHYVPRLYLRSFATKNRDAYLIHVFDKIENRSFQTNITNIGAEKFFYESYTKGKKMEKTLQHQDLF